MPLYDFSVRDSEFEIAEGVHLPDDRSARERAIGIVHELEKADETSWREFTTEVKRDGQVIWDIPFEVSRPPADP